MKRTMKIALSSLFVMSALYPINVHLKAEPEHLDCHTYYSRTTHFVLTQLHRGLYKGNSKEAIPDIAIKASKKGKNTWIIKLREDVYFNDGSKITAHDFVKSWNRLKDPNTKAKYLNAINVMENYKALNDTTLMIKVNVSGIFLPDVLKHSTLCVFEPSMGKYSGAYTLKKQERYNIYLQKAINDGDNELNYKVMNELTAMKMFRKGLDIVQLSTNYAKYANVVLPTNKQYYFCFNHNDEIFNQLIIRYYVTKIINKHKEKIANILGGTESNSLYPNIPMDKYVGIVDKLDQNITFKYTYPSCSDIEENLACYLLKLFKEYNITLKLEKLPRAIYLEKKRNGELQLFSTTWQSFIGDIDYANLLKSGSSSNESKYFNKKYDDFVKQGKFKESQDIALKDYAIVPLCTANAYFLCKNTEDARKFIEELV